MRQLFSFLCWVLVDLRSYCTCVVFRDFKNLTCFFGKLCKVLLFLRLTRLFLPSTNMSSTTTTTVTSASSTRSNATLLVCQSDEEISSVLRRCLCGGIPLYPLPPPAEGRDASVPHAPRRPITLTLKEEQVQFALASFYVANSAQRSLSSSTEFVLILEGCTL